MFWLVIYYPLDYIYGIPAKPSQAEVRMEKNVEKNVEKNEKETREGNRKEATVVDADEPQINYRGIKAMPFIIGLKRIFKFSIPIWWGFLIFFLFWVKDLHIFQEMKPLRSLDPLVSNQICWFISPQCSTWKILQLQLYLMSSMEAPILLP